VVKATGRWRHPFTAPGDDYAKQIEETHYRADPTAPPMGVAGRLASDLGVWLIVAVIVAAIVVAVIYFAPRDHATAIRPGQGQEPAVTLPHAEHRAGGL
jgi:H+/gluconate symporter-like permease